MECKNSIYVNKMITAKTFETIKSFLVEESKKPPAEKGKKIFLSNSLDIPGVFSFIQAAHPNESVEFYWQLVQGMKEWSVKYGKDRQGKPTPYLIAYDDLLKRGINFSEKPIPIPKSEIPEFQAPPKGPGDHLSILTEFNGAIGNFEKTKEVLREICQKKPRENKETIQKSFNILRTLQSQFSDKAKRNSLVEQNHSELLERVFEVQNELEAILNIINEYLLENRDYEFFLKGLERHFGIEPAHLAHEESKSQEKHSFQTSNSMVPPPSQKPDAYTPPTFPMGPIQGQPNFEMSNSNPQIIQSAPAKVESKDSEHRSSDEIINEIKEMLESELRYSEKEEKVMLEFKKQNQDKDFYLKFLDLIKEHLSNDQIPPSQKYLAIQCLWQAMNLKNSFLVNNIIKHEVWRIWQTLTQFKLDQRKSEQELFGIEHMSEVSSRCFYALLMACADWSQAFGVTKTKVETVFRKHHVFLVKQSVYADFLVSKNLKRKLEGNLDFGEFVQIKREHAEVYALLNKYVSLREAFRQFFKGQQEPKFQAKEHQIFLDEFEAIDRDLKSMEEKTNAFLLAAPPAQIILEDQRVFFDQISSLKSTHTGAKKPDFVSHFEVAATREMLPRSMLIYDPKREIEQEFFTFLNSEMSINNYTAKTLERLKNSGSPLLIEKVLDLFQNGVFKSSSEQALRVVQVLRNLLIPHDYLSFNPILIEKFVKHFLCESIAESLKMDVTLPKNKRGTSIFSSGESQDCLEFYEEAASLFELLRDSTKGLPTEKEYLVVYSDLVRVGVYDESRVIVEKKPEPVAIPANRQEEEKKESSRDLRDIKEPMQKCGNIQSFIDECYK